MDSPLRILVIEDSATDAEMLIREVKRAGLHPEWRRVENEADFLAELAEPPDLILSDYRLPHFDGLSAVKLLRARGLDTPFILISGTLGDEAAVEVIKLGVDDYLLKDRLVRLGPAIEQVLEAKRLRDERQQAESRLRQSEINLAASQRIAHLGSWELDLVSVLDLTQGALRWSDEVFRIWGYEPGGIEVSYENFLAAVHPDDRGLIDIAVAAALRESRPYDLTHRIIRPDGAERIVHERAEFQFEEGSRHPLRMIGTVLDITERKQAEENLAKLNERYDLATQAAELGIWDWDVPQNHMTWDDRMFELYGVNREDFSAAYDAWVSGLHPEDVARCEAEIKQALHGEKNFNTEFRVVWPDGSVHHIQAFAQVVRDANGQPLRMTGVNSDITVRKHAEESLRLLCSAVEQSKEAILITDAQLDIPGPHIIFVNPEFTQMTGYRAAEVIGKSPRLLQGPKTDRAMLSRLRENLTRGEPFVGEAVNYRKDGTEYDQEWQIGPIRDEKGIITHYVAIQRDITARKQAVEALRKSEEGFRKISEQLAKVLDSSLDAICTFDAEGRFLQVSAACETIWGYQPHELLGTPSIEKVLPEDQPKTRQAAAHIMAGNATTSFENRYVRKDGSIAHILWSARWSEADESMFCVARDHSERQQREEQIAEQAALIDQAHDAILVRDTEGIIIFWSKGAERLYGWTREEAIGRRYDELLDADSAKLDQAGRFLDQEGEWSGELDKVTKTGNRLTLDCRWTLLLDEAGNPKSYLHFDSDITEWKKIEQQYLRAQRVESIGTLASGIAHDLNNVLGPIMMSLELLKMRCPEPANQELLNILESSAQHGSDMVRQVLSFGRGIEGQKLEVQVKNLIIDLEKIIREIFLKDIQVRTNVPRDLHTVLGDPTQLHQVLLNLCVNARDAMPHGGMLTISAENIDFDEHYAAMDREVKPGSYIMVQVEDSGTGMPPEVIERIFDPFFTTKELGKGTGLGLSTTMSIIKGHGGFLRLYSEVGIGTKFRVYLPVHTEPSEPVTVVPTKDLPRGHGELILVVDDETSVREITKQTLEAFGYRVLLANEGTEAIAIYAGRATEIAAMITDMMMPVMDGPSAIQIIQRINPSVRIIATSGLTTDTRMSRAAELGVKHFLSKPYSAETLLRTLHALLESA